MLWLIAGYAPGAYGAPGCHTIDLHLKVRPPFTARLDTPARAIVVLEHPNRPVWYVQQGAEVPPRVAEEV